MVGVLEALDENIRHRISPDYLLHLSLDFVVLSCICNGLSKVFLDLLTHLDHGELRYRGVLVAQNSRRKVDTPAVVHSVKHSCRPKYEHAIMTAISNPLLNAYMRFKY